MAYNIGAKAFASSTLLRKFNAGDVADDHIQRVTVCLDRHRRAASAFDKEVLSHAGSDLAEPVCIAHVADRVSCRLGFSLMLRGAGIGARIGPNALLMPDQGVDLGRDAVADDERLTTLVQRLDLFSR
ncbi:glycoside hydrolase family protein [Stenotrophomonas maltophilia]|uniref:glycoside hydrolase family protein n=1 Tax=Stenotrophomonas maltophilia TaxID=40324 RepID=UPI003D01FFD7